MLTFLGGGRGCAGALTRPSTRHLLPKNFEKTALRKRVGIFTVKMRGGHIYGNYCTTSSACSASTITAAATAANTEFANAAAADFFSPLSMHCCFNSAGFIKAFSRASIPFIC